MARINIELPAHFPFSTRVHVYTSHINEAGHVDNAQLLTLVSEARQRFFKALGYTQTRVEDVGIVIADAAVQYLSEAFHGEELTIDVATADFNKYGCDLVYRIREAQAGRDVARVKNGIVFYDYTTRKISTVPAEFVRRSTAAGA
ncbi:MAG TPA: thioesterase family protein [Rhodocyclaceae bacterium]|nr:thioesterase family protein [Rhodocyclaceae bacterium]